jgi:hypothetical protein
MRWMLQRVPEVPRADRFAALRHRDLAGHLPSLPGAPQAVVVRWSQLVM